MSKWAGARDYNEWLEYSRGESTDDLLESVKCDIYCISTMFAGKTMPFPWIIKRGVKPLPFRHGEMSP
jgi:hypothetical protein